METFGHQFVVGTLEMQQVERKGALMFRLPWLHGVLPMARMGLHTCLLKWGHIVRARGTVTVAVAGGGSQRQGPEAVERRGPEPGWRQVSQAGLQAPSYSSHSRKDESDRATDVAADPARPRTGVSHRQDTSGTQAR